MKPKPKGPKKKKSASDGGFQEAAIIAATENVMEEVALTTLMQPRTLQIIVALQTTNLPMNRIAEQFEVSRQWVSAVNQKYQVRRN